jgi:hypothetical protein
MGKKPDRRSNNNLRAMLAQEAARLISDHGIEDYRAAKVKAAENLGLRNHGALPTNWEIDTALAERNRLFAADHHAEALKLMRRAAANIMQELQVFNPCLVGSVLSGNITECSRITLHLFSEPVENVGMQLDCCGIHHYATAQKLRVQRGTIELFPGYRLYSDDIEVKTTVFSERRKQHAPLSPLNGKPMRRARLQEVELLAAV